MKLTRSQIILLIVLVVTLWLTWQTAQEDTGTETVMPTRVAAHGVTKPAHIDHSEQGNELELVDRPLVPFAGDLFAKPKQVTPKVIKHHYSKPAPPPKMEPVLPPLPFSYIGRWEDKEKRAVMLDHHGEVLMAKEGDVIAHQYKVESIEESAGYLEVTFLMMPLNKTQILQARIGQP